MSMEEDPKSLPLVAIDRIKEYIISQGLLPGDRLPAERRLAEMLGVSRPVVREALSHLATLGLIEKHQGRGLFIREQNLSRLFQEMMFITSNDREKLQHLLDFRTMLEQAAILQIAGRLADEQIDALARIVKQAETAESAAEFARLDLDFHRKLVSFSPNPYLVQLADVIDNYFAAIEPDAQRTLALKENRQTTLAVHCRLVDLLQGGQRMEAFALISEHLQRKA